MVIKLDLTLATTDFKQACDSVRREMYNILIEFSLPMKLVKAGLHGASRKARHVNKYLAPSYLLHVDINLLLALPQNLGKLMSTRSK
jgi:hypothetical protein